MKLVHGGQLNKVAKQFGLDCNNWLDLSTGISPFSYPIPKIPNDVWRDLPQYNKNLIKAASNYYATKNLLATNGSQSIIQVLPSLWRNSNPQKTRVWLPQIGYKEHERAWRSKGFTIKLYQTLPLTNEIELHDILVVINPNNPTGELIELAQLIDLKHQIQKQHGWLIIDEAFMDVCDKSHSMLSQRIEKNIFVLRSFGKFFGLAGLRLGFVSCHPSDLLQLSSLFGEWSINGPAMFIAEKAFSDTEWQNKQRKRLLRHKNRLLRLLSEYFHTGQLNDTSLFVRVETVKANQIYQQLCLNKVYVRLCDDRKSLRFGIPDQKGLTRLAEVLAISLRVCR